MKKLLWFFAFLLVSSAFAQTPEDSSATKIRELPYKMVNANDVDIKASLSIVSVQDRLDNVSDIKGSSLEGLHIRYERPALREMLGASRILLVGMEFTDRKTKERFWSFSTYSDQNFFYPERSQGVLLAGVDTAPIGRAKLTRWAVVYGHFLADGQTVAVFDTKDSKVKNLEELFNENRSSKEISNNLVAGVDLNEYILRLTPILKRFLDNEN